MTKARSFQAAELRRAGHSLDEISYRMGVSHATVAAHLRIAKKAGVSTTPVATYTFTVELDIHTSRWLKKQVSKGETINDFVRDIIVSTYEMDTGK